MYSYMLKIKECAELILSKVLDYCCAKTGIAE